MAKWLSVIWVWVGWVGVEILLVVSCSVTRIRLGSIGLLADEDYSTIFIILEVQTFREWVVLGFTSRITLVVKTAPIPGIASFFFNPD